MKNYVDRTRSAINELQHEKKIDNTNNDRCTSTGINDDDASHDIENMKMPALLPSNVNK